MAAIYGIHPRHPILPSVHGLRPWRPPLASIHGSRPWHPASIQSTTPWHPSIAAIHGIHPWQPSHGNLSMATYPWHPGHPHPWHPSVAFRPLHPAHGIRPWHPSAASHRQLRTPNNRATLRDTSAKWPNTPSNLCITPPPANRQGHEQTERLARLTHSRTTALADVAAELLRHVRNVNCPIALRADIATQC